MIGWSDCGVWSASKKFSSERSAWPTVTGLPPVGHVGLYNLRIDPNLIDII